MQNYILMKALFIVSFLILKSSIYGNPEVEQWKVLFAGEWYLQINSSDHVDKECGFKFQGNQKKARILFINATDNTLFEDRKIICKKNICKIFLQRDKKPDIILKIQTKNKIIIIDSNSNKIIDNESGNDYLQGELIKKGSIFVKHKENSGGDFSQLNQK
ncbi:MAG: hypothetical protein HS129_11400 [Leptospiraceae bacterium]|nr:hypothetical protein [Leptospiraceae bacterium]NUM42917.1 hypothetical protein [Leptospiraceae bacterium]